jgi:hypothetical protein
MEGRGGGEAQGVAAPPPKKMRLFKIQSMARKHLENN